MAEQTSNPDTKPGSGSAAVGTSDGQPRAGKGPETPLYPTYIPGLDDLLGNGILLPRSCRMEEGEEGKGKEFSGQGIVILIKGKPGSGKSTLALQMALGASLWDDIHGYVSYYSLEQNKEDIEKRIETIFYELQEIIHEEDQHIQNRPIDAIIPLEDGQSSPAANKTLQDRFTDAQDRWHEGKIVIEQEPDIPSNSKSEEPFCETNYPLSWVMRLVQKISNDFESGEKKRLIIVDSINLVRLQDRDYLNIHELVHCLRRSAPVSILIYEPTAKEYDDVDYLSDMIIELKAEMETSPLSVLLNKLSISKSRYQFSCLGWHQYKFFDEGIRIFPSVHKLLDFSRNSKRMQFNFSLETMTDKNKPVSIESAPAGQAPPPGTSGDNYIRGFIKNGNDDKYEEKREESVIVRMLGQILKGSCTVIFGPRRTSKSLLTMDFLRAGVKCNQPGLLLSLIDNSDTILKEKRCLYYKNCSDNQNCTECFRKGVYLYHWQAECVTSSEMLYYINKRIQAAAKSKADIKRLVFWDLTQLEFRFPMLAHDKMFLPTFIEIMKKRNISTLIMGSGKTMLTNAASAMADNMLFCWRDKIGDLSKQGIKESDREGIVKRGMLENDEVVAVYIDRIEGEIDPAKKKLYILPIGRPDSPLADSSYLVEDYTLENPLCLKNATEEIAKIENLQGLPK